MNVRNKITIIIIVITFAFVFYSNIAFSKFFSNYLANQEDAQINSIRRSAESFLNEKNQKYQGSVNDYSHWDETYDYINKINEQEYLENDLIADTFVNIDVNFIIFVGEDNSVRYEQYYNNINR